VKAQGTNYVIFYLKSKSGDQGYPGEVDVLVKYSISGNGLQIDYSVELADSVANENLTETVINLSNHSYFNLSNEATIENHFCEMNATGYLQLDDYQIPTGILIPINQNQDMDFSKLKRFGEGLHTVTQFRGYDHFFIKKEVDTFEKAVKVICNNIGLELWTDAPGFQLYTGNWLDGSCAAKDGSNYGQYSGFCLEASYPPDSLNLEEWREKVLLKKGHVWKRRDLYRIFKCF
jgi:aldose 1-epimerase